MHYPTISNCSTATRSKISTISRINIWRFEIFVKVKS